MSETSGQPQAVILVVDDDPRNARLLARILETEGHRPIVVTDGGRAIDAAAAERPDLVLLDVMMPEVDGFEICRRLKAAPATADLPVLLVTALHDADDKVRGLDAGADDFLTKPFNRPELLARIRTHLRIKRLRDEVLDSRESLQRQNRKLLALERMRADLTHMVVHDLKSPLAAMQLTLEFLLGLSEDKRRPRIEASLHHLSACAARLESLVANVLDVARLEQTEVHLRRERFGWREMVERATAHFHAIARDGRKRLRLELPDGDFASVADVAMIERVMQNLVSNAVRFGGDGDEVLIVVNRAGDGIARIAVADRGHGVPETMREAIFDKFLSLETRRAGRYSNHGLGLTYCKLTVEAHGGTIWVEPRPGGGSRFCFTLPENCSAPAEETEPRAELALAGP